MFTQSVSAQNLVNLLAQNTTDEPDHLRIKQREPELENEVYQTADMEINENVIVQSEDEEVFAVPKKIPKAKASKTKKTVKSATKVSSKRVTRKNTKTDDGESSDF